MADNVTAALHAALAKAIGSVGPVEKRGLNTHHRYKYATAEDMIAVAKDALSSNGLALVPTSSDVIVIGEQSYLNRSWLLTHKDGGAVPLDSSPWPIVPERGRPLDKATAIADTASLRWLLRDLLLIPCVDEVEDQDADAVEPRQQKTALQVPPAASKSVALTLPMPPKLPMRDRSGPAELEDKKLIVGWGKQALCHPNGRAMAPGAAAARIGEIAARVGGGGGAPLTHGQLEVLIQEIEKEALGAA